VLQVETVHGHDYLGHTVPRGQALRPGRPRRAGAVRDGGLELPESPRPLGALTLRDVTEPLSAWAVSLGAPAGDIDPVCHMTVGEGALEVVVGGRRWRFCSAECELAFRARIG
jgi:YHS domain-containing protein